jgi:anion-transporting  ArsA/GET3 family ATPase
VLRPVVRDSRVVICVGSGGVGKTTTSASIALWAALQGRRAVVLTIDPARRLANSLGLKTLGDEPHPVDLGGLGVPARGSLAAMMLDQKGAWDRLIARHAPSEEVRERILKNRFYLNLSQSFAGSYEYMAIEQLCVLAESEQWDLIVLDTPPTKHALDFFEAPERMRDFLDRRMVRWLLMPSLSQGWRAAKALNRTAGFLFRKLEEATGIGALAEVSDFFSAMSGMFDAFSRRTDTIHDILRSKSTAFVLVTGPEEPVLNEAEAFSSRIRAMQMPIKGVVFNRVHEEFPADAELFPAGTVARGDRPTIERALRDARVDGGAAAWMAANFVDYQLLARGEALRLEQFRAHLARRTPIVTVPNFESDLHDVAGLLHMHDYLFRDGGEAARTPDRAPRAARRATRGAEPERAAEPRRRQAATSRSTRRKP